MLKRSKVVVVLVWCALSCRSPASGNTAGAGAPPRAVSAAALQPVGSPAASSSAVSTKKGFEVIAAVLYQGDSVLAQRIVDIKAMAAYNGAIKDTCGRYFAEQTQPELLDIVVALRPGARSRVWFVSSRRADSDPGLSSLRAQLEKLPAPEIEQGPVAFALLASIGGAARDKPTARGYAPPIPGEWKAASDRHAEPLGIPDGILADVWP